MINIQRGDVLATLDGVERRLRLTLGTLAELEQAFGAKSLIDLVQIIATGGLTARNIAMIIAAGLRGAGEAVDTEKVSAMQCEGGAAGFADIARTLLETSFGGEATPGKPTEAPSEPRT